MIHASMRHNAQSIRALVTLTHKLFHNKRRIITIVIGVIMIAAGFLLINTSYSMSLIFIGAVLACYNRFPEMQAASKMIKSFKGEYPSMEYTFLEDVIHVDTTRMGEITSQDIPYENIIKLVRTPSYNFLFNKKRGGCILDLRSFQDSDRERLEKHIAEKTGLSWEDHASPFQEFGFRKKGLK